MSLPPYKHKRNPCLQTEDEPPILGVAGAPLIIHRSVQEKRRTSDQRLARIQNMSGVEFEYEYVPATETCSGSHFRVPSREKMILKPEIEDHEDHQQHPKSKIVNFKCAGEEGPPGPSGDKQDIGECGTRISTRNDVVWKSKDHKMDLKDENNDAKSSCSRQSSVSRRSLVSQSSCKTESSSKSRRSRRRNDSRESLSSTLNAVLKTPAENLCFQKFGRIANGLDDDDLRPRRR